MSNLVYEAFMVERKAMELKLPYLDEYLIESGSIEVGEAKELIRLVFEAYHLSEEAISGQYMTNMRDLDRAEDLALRKVKGNSAEIAKIEKSFLKKRTKLTKDFNKAKSLGKISKMDKLTKLKMYARNKQFKFKALPKAGKAGVVGAGVAAAGLAAAGGYAGYKALKNKQAKAAA